uniref:Uncharacterized protein n=1 Tax=Heterosigma akashiwo TaxID=2829 RepID=A0A7S3XXF9_HETAK
MSSKLMCCCSPAIDLQRAVIQDLPLRSDSEEKSKKKKKTKKSKSKKRSRSLSKEKKKVSSKKTKKDDGTKKSTPVGPAPGWLAEHIRVRVVSEDLAGGRFFRQKGVVLEVPAQGRADLRMDSGARLENVRERHLETALPKAAGGRVLVLRGARRFERGALLARDLGAEVASVQLEDDMDVVQLPLDDIAEFVAGGAR